MTQTIYHYTFIYNSLYIYLDSDTLSLFRIKRCPFETAVQTRKFVTIFFCRNEFLDTTKAIEDVYPQCEVLSEIYIKYT